MIYLYLRRSSRSFSLICRLFVGSLLRPLFERYSMLLLVRPTGLTFHFGFSQFFAFCKMEGLVPGHPNAGLVRTLLPHLCPHRILSHAPCTLHPIPRHHLHPNAANSTTRTPTPMPRRDGGKRGMGGEGEEKARPYGRPLSASYRRQ